MTNSNPIKAAFSEAQVSDHTGAGASYVAFGSAASFNIHGLVITSTFNQSVYISTDGTTDMLLVPGGGSILPIDFSGNKQGTSKLSLPIGTQFYLKQGPDGAPTSGDISISGIYAR